MNKILLKNRCQGFQISKEEVKLSLCARDMILTNSVKSQDTKSIYRNLAVLYTNNEAAEREIKKTIPFTIALKPTKYLGLNLTKEVKDLYSEN